ncbi:MAG: DNA repair protein RecO [Candidatus Lloydbacteria bacterium]|nr:DNA repair protein RecO [Candidatus Lloydbacteria bacterium]
MSHHIYTTEGIVLGGISVGESNRYVYILTKNLGLVGAHVQGARELRSKLRFALDNFSHTEIAMVRGKDMWRVTSAIPLPSYQALFFDRDKLRTFARTASLVRRLVAGETEHAELFDFIFRMALFLASEKLTAKELACVEALSALSVLDALGYGEKNPAWRSFVGLPSLDRELLKAFEPHCGNVTASVSRSLRESHL